MAILNEKELNKHIKEKNFVKIYLIYGDEQMYVKKYTDKLVKAIVGKNPNDFNFIKFFGEINLDEFANAVQTIPFMAEYNCVYLSDIRFDEMNAYDLQRFEEITKIVPFGTILILSMPSYKPSKNKSALDKFKKYADKNGIVCEFQPVTDTETVKFIAKWANENGKIISHVNATKLMSYCGKDLNLLKNEVNKISSYAKSEEITIEDIEKLATVNLEYKIFSLADAVLQGNSQKAFNILDNLFYQREEPIAILYVLSNSYIDAYRMRVADECGVIKDEVSKTFAYKKRAFVLDSVKRTTKKVSTKALRKSLDLLLKADIDFKSINVNYRYYMEELISQLLLVAKEEF